MPLLPVFVAFLSSKLPLGDWFAVGIFVIAALTDSFDGYLARKLNQTSAFGAFLNSLNSSFIFSCLSVTAPTLSFNSFTASFWYF